jgi:excisionase family DNA binding protein
VQYHDRDWRHKNLTNVDKCYTVFVQKGQWQLAEAPSYVTLKRAAQTLGVHEQTLRNWEKSGVIRMIRLPGSGYRRVPVDEIKRLQEEMALSQNDLRIRVVPPPQDAESLVKARALADAVCAELSDLDSEITLDGYMASGRGRAWLF